MSWFRVIFVFAVVIGAAARADGPLPQLSDPVVIAPVPPVVVAPVAAPPLDTVAGLQTGDPGGQSLGGYPVNIAWDHVAVGALVLGVMYALGADAAASGTF